MRKIFYVVAGLLIVSGRMSITAQQAVVDTTNVYELNEVVVSAVQAKRETPVAFRNVSAAELRENNTGQSLPYLFTQTPSVVVTSDGGNGVGYVSMRVRGTDAGRINFTVDGVPVNDSESHGVFWVNMPDFASSVESIQIQRGAGTSTNGAAAFGATVAMQTQRPRRVTTAPLRTPCAAERDSSATISSSMPVTPTCKRTATSSVRGRT